MDIEKNENGVITVEALFNTLKKSFLWILLFATVLAGAMGVYTKLYEKTVYSTNLSYVVKNLPDTTGNAYLNTAYVSGASEVAENCLSYIQLRPSIQKIVSESGLAATLGLTEEQTITKLAESISLEHKNNSIFFFVKIKGSSPEEVKVMAEATRNVLTNQLNSLFKSNDGTAYVTVESLDSQFVVSSSRPSAAKRAALTFVVAAIVAYCIFFAFDMFDRLVYDEKQLKENFSYPVLGTIPDWYTDGEKRHKRNAIERLLHRPCVVITKDSERNFNHKMLSDTTPFSVSEAFKQLRTNVEYSKSNDKTPVYAVTSAYSGVGKSLVLSNLAMSFANLGKKTLLVECDMRLPVFDRIFGTDKQGHGLSELLAGIEPEPSKVICNVAENYDVVTSGHVPPNPSELLGQKKMKELLDKWREEYDIVFLDMPPIGEVTDAGIVANLITGYLIVARSEYSDVPSITEMLHALEKVNGSVVGFVINDVCTKGSTKYYSKNYGKYQYAKTDK